MFHKFLLNESFHMLLTKIDQELAEKTRLSRCSCGGSLHQANYPRSPFGLPGMLEQHYQQRYSFCCSQCRKRITPPSVRFFGRSWFPAPLMVLLSALRLGATEYRCTQIRKYFGIKVSRSTWKRWHHWWSLSFTETCFWIQAKGIIPISHLNGLFPRKLLSLFIGCLEDQLISLLRFLAPLTGGIFRAI